MRLRRRSSVRLALGTYLIRERWRRAHVYVGYSGFYCNRCFDWFVRR